MRVAYPIFIVKEKNTFLVYIPDIDIYTEGHSPADAMAMARDAICLTEIEMKGSGQSFPAPSTFDKARSLTEKNADDEDFKYSKGICTLVDIDFEDYRKKLENRSVKKNCTIPYWLSVEADKAGINYSRALQDALKDKLKLKEG